MSPWQSAPLHQTKRTSCRSRRSRATILTNITNYYSAFFSEKLIFDPLRSTWLDISQCIWHGPSFMRYKTVIATHYGNEPLLKSFFTATLELQDIQISDIFFELRCRRIAFVPSMSTNVAGEMYAFLNANMSADKTWAAAKYVLLFHFGFFFPFSRSSLPVLATLFHLP